MRKFLLILLILLFVHPARAAFAYKGTFTVQSGQMPSSQSDFPFLIYWTDNVLKQTGSGGQVTDVQGDDIRPYSNSDCSMGALTYQRFFYDGTAGTIGMRVKSTGGVGHTIYLCVGDSSITTDGSSTAAWDSNFLATYQLGDGSTLALTDGTSNGHTLTNNGASTATSGKVGGAVQLIRSSNQSLSRSNWLSQPAAMTVTAWTRGDAFTGSYNAIVLSQSAGSTAAFNPFIKSDGKLACYVAASASVNYDGTGSNTLSTATWYHLAFSYNSTDGLKGYVNGGSDGSAAANGALASATSTLSIGDDFESGTREFDGKFDEVKISNVARSADWINSEYKNEDSQSTFWGSVTFDAVGGGGGGARGSRMHAR